MSPMKNRLIGIRQIKNFEAKTVHISTDDLQMVIRMTAR